MDDGGPEEGLAWNLAGLPGAVSEATFFTSANAAQFRLLVAVLFDQQGHSLTGVARADLPALLKTRLLDTVGAERAAALLADESFNLDGRLAQLVKWRTIEVWQDEARTDEDFLRTRERYQLSERGAALHRVLVDLDRERDNVGSAALLAPPIISDRLGAALRFLAEDQVDEASLALTQVQTTVDQMATAAGRWQSRLAAGLGGAPTEEKVARLRQTVLDYIEVWGAGVDIFSEQIVAATRRLLEEPPQRWRAMALHRRGTSVADAELTQEAEAIQATLQVMLDWFLPSGQASRLRRQVRDAVAPLLRGHRTLLAVGGAVSRRATLLELAARLDSAPSDAAAQQLWSQASGLFGARHLGLAAPESDPGVAAWESPPVPVELRLRASGPRAVNGKPALLADTSRHRAAARTRALAERARLAEAEAALAQRSGTRLSQWPELDADQAELLLDLLSVAWSRRVDAGSREAVSRDGRWTARFHPVQPRASAALRLPTGTLIVEDAVLELLR